jgi:hypothetical protein
VEGPQGDEARPARPSCETPAKKIAVVVGGAVTVEAEIAKTRELLNGHPTTWFVVNDMIERFPEPCVAVSLHRAANRLKTWLDRRAANGHPQPSAVWSAPTPVPDDAPVTHMIEDWRGSSGMFGARVALHLGFEKIILCGVPMDPTLGNVRGTVKWDGCSQFIAGWIDHHQELAPHVRSWSGWTKDRLGAPDAEFLQW